MVHGMQDYMVHGMQDYMVHGMQDYMVHDMQDYMVHDMFGRAPACQPGGPRFKSRSSRFSFCSLQTKWNVLFKY